MGNVHASSQNPGGLGNVPPPPSSPTVEESESAKLDHENPGTLEELHKECREIFPMNFEGAKIVVNKGLSSHFQISHTLSMSSVTPSGYKFGATYVGTNQLSPTEVSPILTGDIDPSGNLNAHIIYQYNKALRTKFVAQVQKSTFVATQLTQDYLGKDFSGTLTLGNIDVINNAGVAVAHYLQNVTSKVALGAELAYQYGPHVPGCQLAVLSAAGRYKGVIGGRDYTVSGTLGSAGLHLCYYQKASEQLKVGVELETNFRIPESVATVGYMVDIPRGNFVFRGMLDSNWTVGAVLEKKLHPLPFTFALSGYLNHSKSNFRLGCGFIIG